MSQRAGRWSRFALALSIACAALLAALPTALAAPGDASLVIPINDSHAGVTYQQEFELAYSGATPDGTPVYIYVPEGGVGTVEGVASLDPAFDPNSSDDFTPCAQNDAADYLITQAQIDQLGAELTNRIVAVDEAHFGEMGGSAALVTLVYNVQDQSYYDCAEDTYTAGYFAPEYLTSTDMNVIVIDAFDWANRVGDQSENPDGASYLYEGVIAHELEHLLHHYSDPGELSWVDEGLADFAVFLNGYPTGGSHVAYHQVFHRETSLTRWGGGLENYGASYTFFQYLWEQAGGNGDDTYTPDQEYDAAGGDLLIKLIFENQADGVAGVQAAIAEFNAQTGANLRSFGELYKDWAVAIYLDLEGSDRFDIKALDFGDPEDSWGYTITSANRTIHKHRGLYGGAMPEAKWGHARRVPAQTALPYGVSYEIFRNPGPTFSLSFQGDPVTSIAPHSDDTHWYGGYESQANNILNVDAAVAGGQTIDFWTWYFIEEGWDYGFVEALVGTEWVTIPLTNDAGQVVTTNTNPHDNNTEGNGLTGTSGGRYFVDQPQYIHLTGTLPDGATDVRFRYSTDAAYLDTGWFVDDVRVNGAEATVSSPEGEWIETTGEQTNSWVVQLVAPCDITPGTATAGETAIDDGLILYRFTGGQIEQAGFDTRCMNGTKGTITAIISNMPSGDLSFLDANYQFRITNTSNKKK
jgi:hypothetical protein